MAELPRLPQLKRCTFSTGRTDCSMLAQSFIVIARPGIANPDYLLSYKTEYRCTTHRNEAEHGYEIIKVVPINIVEDKKIINDWLRSIMNTQVQMKNTKYKRWIVRELHQECKIVCQGIRHHEYRVFCYENIKNTVDKGQFR